MTCFCWVWNLKAVRGLNWLKDKGDGKPRIDADIFIVSVPVKKFDISGMSCSDIKLLPEREVRKALKYLTVKPKKMMTAKIILYYIIRDIPM